MPSPSRGGADGPYVSAHGLPPLPPHLDPRGKHRGADRPNGGVWHGVRLGSRVLATVLSMLLLVTFGVYWWNYRSFNSGLNRLDIFGASSIRTPSNDIDGKDQNILIVGNDDRQTMTDAEVRLLHTGRDGGSLNTDTMMIVHVPADGAKATLISLPRDSYVAIPGYGMNKLNAAYPSAYTAAGGSTDARRAAGAKLLVQTIDNLTGLTVDHFVQVDQIGFYRISNAVGGVTVDMCAAVQDKNSNIDLPKGKSVIKGAQALAFVRQRYNFPDGNGDLDRVQRQRYFLTATFRKLVSAGTILNPIKLQKLLSAVRSSMYMDSSLDPLSLARQMENLSADNIVGKTIPTTFRNGTDVGDVLAVDPAEVKSFINKLIGPVDSTLGSAKALSPSSVTLDVMNAGSGVNGAAHQNADVLRQQGFGIGTVGDNASASTSTAIEYAGGMEAQAKTLAAYVPGATLQKVDSIDHVTLLLGSDGLTAQAAPAKTPQAGSTPSTTTTAKPKAIDSGCIN